jgi:hypothetical protein
MHNISFTECVLRPSTEICYPYGRGTHERRVTLHFYNAPIHNGEGVQSNLANFGFRIEKNGASAL